MAIYGLGNQILYPDHFVDTIHYIKEEIEKNGGKVFGEWPTDGFDFTDSQAIENDKFEGLPLDEDNENDLTDSRILKWLETYKNNFH